MNGSQSNIIQYTILELMATIVSFEWGILKKHVPPYLHIGSKSKLKLEKKLGAKEKSKNASVIFLLKKKR